MSLTFQPISEFGVEAAAEVLTRGFADYFVRIAFNAPALLQAARSDSIDLAASQVVLRDRQAVGAALIARRGWTSRLAGMALIPESRRQGVGAIVVDRLLIEARDRGDREMVLEVVEQNVPAVALYEKCGFQKIRRLVGFAAEPTVEISGMTGDPPEEVDLRAMAMSLVNAGPDWPWQLSTETVAHFGPPNQSFRRQGAFVAVAGLTGGEVSIRAISTGRLPDGIHRAAELLRALRARFPQKRWQIKAVWPEEYGSVFLEAGFQRTALTQWQMVRALEGAPIGR